MRAYTPSNILLATLNDPRNTIYDSVEQAEEALQEMYIRIDERAKGRDSGLSGMDEISLSPDLIFSGGPKNFEIPSDKEIRAEAEDLYNRREEIRTLREQYEKDDRDSFHGRNKRPSNMFIGRDAPPKDPTDPLDNPAFIGARAGSSTF